MAEPTIKARLVLDTGGLKGTAAGLGVGKGGGQSFAQGLRGVLEGLDFPVIGDIGAALAGGVLLLENVLKVVKKGFDFLTKASPLLSNSLTLLKKSFEIMLRPIGDAIGLFIKPFAIAMLRFAIPIYKKWREFLSSDKASTGLGQINEGVGQLASGVINLDFGQVKEGFLKIVGGLKSLAAGFFEFSAKELVGFWDRFKSFIGDAWEEFKSVFWQVSSWLKEKATDGLMWGWNTFWDFIAGLGDEDWKNIVKGLKTGFESAWDEWMSLIEQYKGWGFVFGPAIIVLENLLAAMDFSGMVNKLKQTLEESIPGFTKLASLLEKTDGEESWIGWVISRLNEAIQILLFPFKAAVDGTKKLFGDIFGNPETGIPKDLDTTKIHLEGNISTVSALNTELSKLDTTYTTTHIIKTVHITEGE